MNSNQLFSASLISSRMFVLTYCWLTYHQVSKSTCWLVHAGQTDRKQINGNKIDWTTIATFNNTNSQQQQSLAIQTSGSLIASISANVSIGFVSRDSSQQTALAADSRGINIQIEVTYSLKIVLGT
jgi:hypothetical protein